MRISDWSSDVCSSDLPVARFATADLPRGDRFAAWQQTVAPLFAVRPLKHRPPGGFSAALTAYHFGAFLLCHSRADAARYLRSGSRSQIDDLDRSEEHTSELQSLMRISYAVFCLKNKI